MSEAKKKGRRVAYPFYLQYAVKPSEEESELSPFAGGIATVIVFAENEEVARARAARQIARQKWVITEVLRGMVVRQHHFENMDGVVRATYLRAEQEGVAVTIDGWQKPDR